MFGARTATDAAAGTPLGAALPRTPRLDAVRDALRVRRDMLGVATDRYRRFGPAVLQRNGLLDLVSLFGPEANRLVLLDREKIFSAKRAWDLIMGRIFGGGLLLRDGDDHRHHRKIMQGAFQTPALRAYLEGMAPQIEAGLDGWRAGRLEAFPAYKRLTLDLACSVFLGIELGAGAERMVRAFEDSVAASMSFLRLPLPGLEFNRGLQGRRFMQGFFGGLIAEKRAGQGTDLFSRLCRAEGPEGERYADDEIVDHLIFLMMAAHDTTTSTLTSLTYELARHPAWQERVREECRGLGDALGYDDLLRVPELTKVLNETLRRYPPLSTIPRVPSQPFEFAGHEIPAGVMLSIYPIHTHHMDEWWTEPFAFDPERFAPGREEHKAHSHLFVPFGGGNHMCLGLRFAEMQVKAIVFQLVRRFRWSVPEGYRMPVQQAPISKPRDGLPIELSPLR